MFRDVIIGGGEVGKMLYEVLKSKTFVSVMDLDPAKAINIETDCKVDIMHICVPYAENFVEIVKMYDDMFKPIAIIIHSTVKVGTSLELQKQIDTHIITSPVRGIHKRFVEDVLKYPKWFAFNGKESGEIKESINERFDHLDIVWKESGLTCEKAKLYCDTTYYGYLIAYRKMVDEICHDDEIWKFADEINENLGNRPVMFNDHNKIGGHCVVPNLELLIDDPLSLKIKDTIKRYE